MGPWMGVGRCGWGVGILVSTDAVSGIRGSRGLERSQRSAMDVTVVTEVR
jgi:hypothetical protein